MLDNDVHDQYLPPRPWDPSILVRASRLYRLRRLGLRGDVLRQLLFLRDGWGWERVKPVVLKGLQKLTKANQVGIKEVVRNPTPSSLAFVAGEAADRQRRHLLTRLGKPEDSPLQVREATMGFIWGQGLFGAPLPQGSLRTFAPLFRGLYPELSEEDATLGVEFLEELFRFTGLTWKNYEELIEFADAAILVEAAERFWDTIRIFRARVHEGALAESRIAQSTNPLTFFGHWHETGDFWKKVPERITPAQVLGAYVAMCVVGACLPMVIGAKIIEMLQAPEPAPPK
jgi:hypothetical protein